MKQIRWWQISLILCAYGFFKEYRPSEPFITPYLTGPWKNFTKEQVNQDIYPLGTYVNLVILIAVFLLTDFLRYKPVIILGGVSAIITWSLIRWGTTIPEMQVVEIFYGLFMASEVAYYTYIYAKVDKKHYQKVTSHTRTAFLLGKAGAGLSSQLFVSYNVLDYEQLNYTTIAGVSIATLSSLFLPSASHSIYFHRRNSSNEVILNSEQSWNRKYRDAFALLFRHFIDAFSNMYVLKWSLWWALATCGYLQVTSYGQLLWEDINADEAQNLYNGFVEFGYSLLGSFVTFAVGFIHLKWDVLGEFILAVVSLLQGFLMIYSAFATNLIVAYIVYMLFGFLYQSVITIASSEVAKYIKEDSYALVFGVNTFVALLLQTILTAVVIEALKLSIRHQFIVYGGYYVIIGIGFFLVGTVSCCFRRKS